MKRKRISEMTHHERRMFLINVLDEKRVVGLCRQALRIIDREYREIERLAKKAKKLHAKD